MAGSVDDTNEWELSKENIQPLRQGRKFSLLTAALQPHSDDQQKIKEQKEFFESELRTYDGDDPLEVWHQYIKWIEQAYPKGGKDGKLQTLLERCITKFKDYEQYKNDPRNIEAWVKFANFCTDPIEIFTFMFDQGLGCQLAMLYEAWAWSLELIGNRKKADQVFQEGIKRRAEPVEVLVYKHQEFQVRTMKETMKGTESDEDLSEDQRTVLGQLKTAGKHKTVGTVRTGAVKSASRGGVIVHTDVKTKPQIQQQPFEIFTDENSVDSAPVQTGEWKTVPKRPQANRENEKKPGPWNKVKLPQKAGLVAAASVPSVPAFAVYEDTQDSQDIVQQPKLPEWNDGILSAKKAEKPPLHHIQQASGQAANVYQIPMYCKDKIYAGLGEFSFEEIRAAHMLAKMKKREEERRLLEEKRQIEEQRQQLLREREELASQQEKMRREMNKMQQLRQQIALQTQQQQQQQISSEWKVNAAEQRAEVERNFQRLSVTAVSSTVNTEHDSGGHVTKQLNFDDMTLPAGVIPDSGQGQGQSVAGEGLNSSQRTPSLTLPLNTTHSSGSTRSRCASTPDSDSFYRGRGALTAPSPTVCTLEAISTVRGMFNSSLESDKRLNSTATLDLREGVHQAEAELISNQESPFTIYCENNTVSGNGAPSIQIYCDNQENKENCPVAGREEKPAKRKPLAGVLQPSLGVPVDPTGENDYLVEVQETQIKSTEDYEIVDAIEQRAHDDFTIAAVGSSESFSAAAKFASTPYNRSSDSSHNNNSNTSSSSSSNLHQSNVTQPQRFDPVTPSKKGLSPILEGMSEGSSEESNASSRSAGCSSMFHQSNGGGATQPVTETKNKHCIDMTTYVRPDVDSKTAALLDMSIHIDPRNPFDEETVKAFLKTLATPLTKYPNYYSIESKLPRVSANAFVYLGEDSYQVVSCIAEGGFGKIFCAEQFDMENMLNFSPNKIAIKVQRPACPWEFYICCEIAERLRKLQLPMDITPSIMSIEKGYFFTDGSCLVNTYHKYGTLLNLVNLYGGHKEHAAVFESFAVYITIELLHIVENLHKCHIIHGDLKPDNFLIINIPLFAGESKEKVFGSKTKCLKLIDFGRSIDMDKYPPQTTFTAQSNTSGFQCIEMKTNRPWTYQTDLFGLAGTVHVILFNSYMKVYQQKGVWHMTSNFVRKWNVPLWKHFFETLLNVPSCNQLPDLSRLRKQFEDYFLKDLVRKYNPIAEKVAVLLKGTAES